MKRVTILVLIMCLALVGLSVSCKNEVEPVQETDRLVAIGFNDATSRALSSNLEAFNAADYYWAYAAQKADSSRLRSGETATYTVDDAKWVKADDNVPVKGLGNSQGLYKVEGFSQGLWNFKLFAYKDADKTQLVYQGETTGVLLKSSATNAVANHTVNVIVSPISSEEYGTLQILTASSETDHITMTLLQAYASEAPEYGVDYFPRVLSIATLDENPDEKVDDLEGGTIVANGTISLPAGTYKVTVAFSDKADSSATVNYARGTVIATVYSNLTTTIKGNLNEADVYAEFTSNQSINTVTGSTGFEEATIAAAPAPVASSVAEPDEVGSEHKTSDSTPSAKTTVSSSATAVTEAEDKKTTVTIPAAGLADTVVTKTLEQKTDENNKVVITETISSTHDLSMKVTDSVNTSPSSFIIAEGQAAVAGVNLTLTKTTTTFTETATTTGGTTQTVTSSSTADKVEVSSFNEKYVTVSTYISTYLNGVSVKYDGTGTQPIFDSSNTTPSVEVASADASSSSSGTGYNPTTGLLVFKTDHFSSYVVICINSTIYNLTTETYYDSLYDAISAVPDNTEQTLILIKNINSSSNGNYIIPAEKNIVLDLNGHKINVVAPNETTAYTIENKGTLTIKDSTDVKKDGTGSGKIELNAINPDGQSIPGYASNVITNRGTLYIESGWIHNASTDGTAAFAIDQDTRNAPTDNLLVINGGRITTEAAMSIRQCVLIGTKNDVIINRGVVGSYWIQNYGNSTTSATGSLVVNNVQSLYSGRFDLGYSIDYKYNIKGDDIDVKINGGSFKNIKVYHNNNANTKIIYGGTFTANVSDLCKEGFFTRKTGESCYTILPVSDAVDSDYVAYIGSTGYFALSSALSAANGNPVKLNADIRGYLMFNDGGTYTLDLNGHNITNYSGSGNTDTINVYGNSNLTITDTSTGEKGTISSEVGVAIWTGSPATDTSTITINGGVHLVGDTYCIQSSAGQTTITLNAATTNKGNDINSGSSLIDNRQ